MIKRPQVVYHKEGREMKKVVLFCFPLVFALLFFSSSAHSAVVILTSQNKDNRSAAAYHLQMPLLIKVLRAAEYRFSVTSKWHAYRSGFYAIRKNTTGLFERSNGLRVRVFWNGSYGVYCGTTKGGREVLFSDWETLLANKNKKSDLCR